MHRKQKIAPDVKQQNTELNWGSRFNWHGLIERIIESNVTLDVPIIVTRLVSALRKGSSFRHIWVNVENLAMQKNDQYFAKALPLGSCPLWLRSYSLALDRTNLYTAIAFSTSHRLWREYIKRKQQNVSVSFKFYRKSPLSSKVYCPHLDQHAYSHV